VKRAGIRDAEANGAVPVPRKAWFGLPAFRYEAWLTDFFWLLALALGFLQAWKMRFVIDHDAVSYLDMGDAYFRGDWKMALNGYFNPFYAWLLGLALRLFHPGPEWEYPLVHLVGYLIFIFCLWCFSFFFKELLSLLKSSFATEKTAAEDRLGRIFWLVLGYTVFIWSSLGLITVSGTNPDMLIAAIAYLATALIVRVQRKEGKTPVYALLGGVLGVGYLTKAIFLPLAFVFLGVAFSISHKTTGATKGPLLAGIIFALLAGPFIVALSLAKGHFTTSDTGRLNYAWYVGGVPVRHWQGGPPEAGTPLHPTRLLFAAPATYEFATPVGGTYPVWYDISYWYEGLKVPFSLQRQASALKTNLEKLARWTLELDGVFVIGCIVLLLAAGRPREVARNLWPFGTAIIPSMACLCSYALITVERRYVGAFITIALLSVVAILRVKETLLSRLVFAGFAVVAFVLLLGHIRSVVRLQDSGTLADVLRLTAVGLNEPAEMAEGLKTLGIGPGTWVAGVDYSKGQNLAWARLARLRIVCEVFYSPTMIAARQNNFWRASGTTQNLILEAFARAGAKAVVSDEAPPADSNLSATWNQVGRTHFYVHLLTGLDARTCSSGREKGPA
jgi:hypothetical protein